MTTVFICACILLIIFAAIHTYSRKYWHQYAAKKSAFRIYQSWVVLFILLPIAWAVFLAWDLSEHHCHEFCNGYDAVGRVITDLALGFGLGFCSIVQGWLFFVAPKQISFMRWKKIAGVSAVVLPITIYFAFWRLIEH